MPEDISRYAPGLHIWSHKFVSKQIRLLADSKESELDQAVAGSTGSLSCGIFMSSSLFAAAEHARARFRQDVTDQLRMVAENAGLAGSVTLDRERAVLEFNGPALDGSLPRFVAAFNDGSDGETGSSDRLTLYAEVGDEPMNLLTLAWRHDPELDEQAALQHRLAELEARTDESLPLDRRGLNAPADERTGRYARGDVLRQLAGDLKRAAARAPLAFEQSHALVPIKQPRPVLTRVPDREEPQRGPPPAPVASDIETQRANVSEFLISSLMQALQRDLAEAESHFVGPGVAATARGRFGRIMEWAMLGTAYGVEAKTNQMAVSTFLGSEGASWLYGLVGPVLIGGLASVSKSKLGKGAAYGLMMSWALAMATITASEKSYLDRAQGFFSKQAQVVTQEQAVATARVRKEAAEAELNRLNAPVKGTSSLLADAKKRWQAAEIKRAAERDSALRAKDRERARQAVIEARVALNKEELQLREAMLDDPSRAWAWRTLFLIFGVINLAGPMAISRVLEQWRADHAEAVASAKDGHRKKSAAALLRGSRSAQKAHAMLLLPALLDGLKRSGVTPEMIAGLDLGDMSHKAAERFDRGVNGKRTARRLFGLRGPAEGPT
jgi:hypothetical protein